MSEKNLSLELWSSLSKSFDAVRKAHAKQIANHKLTAPQFGVLEVLTAKGSMPLKKISEELLVTGANITCVVDNLEKEELVKRVPSKEDRRIILAELTSKGSEKYKSIYPEYVQNISGVTSNISENEKKTLNKLLTKLVS